MLNQIHPAADIAADHRRTLLAEADAYRLARITAPVRTSRRLSARFHLRRLLTRRATGIPGLSVR